jgi:hypothetical protein
LPDLPHTIAKSLGEPLHLIGGEYHGLPASRRAREGDKWFRQEYLCEFVEREGAVFSQESIDAALQDFEPLDL